MYSLIITNTNTPIHTHYTLTHTCTPGYGYRYLIIAFKARQVASNAFTPANGTSKAVHVLHPVSKNMFLIPKRACPATQVNANDTAKR